MADFEEENDSAASLANLVPIIYADLRRVARRQLRRLDGRGTLDTTGLVHEAYAKLAGGARLRLEDREHLMAVSARAMRQVLVSRARARLRSKRGGPDRVARLPTEHPDRAPDAERLIDLDRALRALKAHSSDLAGIFECRYFGGFSEEETARALGLPLRTVQRGWMRARAWLRYGLDSSPRAGQPASGPGKRAAF